MIQIQHKLNLSLEIKLHAQNCLRTLLNRSDLGFTALPSRNENWQSSRQFAAGIKEKSDALYVIGMGGSALGGQCLVRTLATTAPVEFIFNTDPFTVQNQLNALSHHKAPHFLFISKSGNTLEVACLIEIIEKYLKSGGRNPAESISVITEERDNLLRKWATSHGIPTLAHPLDVGGRFSALSTVGLVPAAYAGIEIERVRDGALSALAHEEVIAELAAIYYESFNKNKNVSVFWTYVDQMQVFSPWLVQLWAESLCKKLNRSGQPAPKASTPVTYQGTCDQHSVLQMLMEDGDNKTVCFLRAKDLAAKGPELSGKGLPEFQYLKNLKLGEVFHIQSQSTEQALYEANVATLACEIEKVDPYSLGELMMTFELLIGVLGEMLNIDAFDQPGVENGKKITKKKLQESSRL